jgi:hypothetical protein
MGDGPANYPYVELEFAKDGSPVHPEQAGAVRQLAEKVSDVVVISHGWNNDMDEARRLYRDLFASMDAVRAGGLDLGARTIGVVGILWPSKRFTDAELIAGGAASAGEVDPALPADLRGSADAFDHPDAAAILDRAAELADRLEDSPKAQREYADLLRSLVQPDAAEPADAPEELFTLDGPDLLDRLHAAARPGAGTPHAGHDLDDDSGGAASVGAAAGSTLDDETGEAAGFGSNLKNLWSKGRGLLNYVTYYEMKARAGRIGAGSVAPVLRDTVSGRATLHLVGHSFGARLVTATADALNGSAQVGSVSLLQAAFSHNAFAKDFDGKPGGYRRLVDEHRVAGPFIITHTRNDKAVGIAYAIASSLAGQTSSDVGDKDSPYGGLGSNGAQRTTEASQLTLLGEHDRYQFTPGAIHNLLADKFVTGHGDVHNAAVANAVLQNLLTATRT